VLDACLDVARAQAAFADAFQREGLVVRLVRLPG
jgi:hypothetical protein